MKYCPYCGAMLYDDMSFCPKCGKQFKDVVEDTADNNLMRQASVSEIKNSTSTEEDKIAQRLPLDSGKKGITHPAPVILALVLLLTVVIGGVFFAINSGRSDEYSEPEKNFINDSKKIDAAAQSVVMVYCYDNNGILIATGSGFVVYDDSTIATNNHVIEEAFDIKISTEQDHTFAIKSILAYDVTTDIALLKTESPTGLLPLKVGTSSEMLKGDGVLAIGSPEGLKNTISTGVLSGRSYDSLSGMNVLQISAPISYGSSGGALFDEEGSVIGITFAGFTEGQNLNFAIPIEELELLYNKGISSCSLLEYLQQTNPDIANIYSCEYVETSELYGNPDKYNGKNIAFIAYCVFEQPLYGSGNHYAYASLDDVGKENEYGALYRIVCFGDSRLSDAEGCITLLSGKFEYHEGKSFSGAVITRAPTAGLRVSGFKIVS